MISSQIAFVDLTSAESTYTGRVSGGCTFKVSIRSANTHKSLRKVSVQLCCG